jgi:CheY-like chemotaxis protein
LRDLLKEQLERLGATVCDADDGRTALKTLETSRFDLILSDFQMPRLDGMGLIKEAKSKFLDCPPIYIMSGHTNFEEKDFIDAGASGYIEKPLSLKTLKDLLKHVANK